MHANQFLQKKANPQIKQRTMYAVPVPWLNNFIVRSEITPLSNTDLLECKSGYIGNLPLIKHDAKQNIDYELICK